MFVVKSDRTHYPCWLCQGQAIFSKFRENKSFIVSARNKAKNKKKLLLCFFCIMFWLNVSRMCSDRWMQRYSQKRFLQMFWNNVDIKNMYMFVLRQRLFQIISTSRIFIFLFCGINLRPPLLPDKITLALPCGGLSAVSQFLAESSMHYKVKYRPDLETCIGGDAWRCCSIPPWASCRRLTRAIHVISLWKSRGRYESEAQCAWYGRLFSVCLGLRPHFHPVP